jgi:very-short-patch-repair endonuclease
MNSFQQLGWTVLRFWETDILRDLETIVQSVIRAVRGRA